MDEELDVTEEVVTPPEEETNADDSVVKLLVSYACKVRSVKELELVETVSTRLLINAGKLIANGLDSRLACNIAIIQPLTDDLLLQKSLIDLMSLFF